MSSDGYRRYVAIGDSQTEGLWDGDDDLGVVGFADRLAATIDSTHPGLMYANLAIRGKRTAEVIAEQLEPALLMRPDLISVCVGMNDALRPGRAFDQAMVDLRYLYARLAESGATVMTTTFPDLTRMLPVGRLLTARLRRVNGEIRAAANRHGLRLVDLHAAESMSDPATWSPDWLHASTHGHTLFAAAAAEALDLPGASHDWATAPTVRAGNAPRVVRIRAQLQWTRHMLLPWIIRHARGRSSGDGRAPKRPQLEGLAHA